MLGGGEAYRLPLAADPCCGAGGAADARGCGDFWGGEIM